MANERPRLACWLDSSVNEFQTGLVDTRRGFMPRSRNDMVFI
ncbi:hypothetical protein PALB_14840 [Pseudoalteromonas luteoviolacea B = ATCC 29581]|nr:hypothetical protein PALB_14840 [Pseudoalteromonas luteoviolacea B = ATCC 29581]